jgi:hypothetical protein
MSKKPWSEVKDEVLKKAGAVPAPKEKPDVRKRDVRKKGKAERSKGRKEVLAPKSKPALGRTPGGLWTHSD